MQFLVKQILPKVHLCVRLLVRRAKKISILDAKYCYHSVPLKKGESQAVNEFLCEFGCYRCIGSGQGLICSGDACTHRVDNITSQFTNVVRCVDDSLLWEDDMKSSLT